MQVITLSCTAGAFFAGSLFNALTRIQNRKKNKSKFWYENTSIHQTNIIVSSVVEKKEVVLEEKHLEPVTPRKLKNTTVYSSILKHLTHIYLINKNIVPRKVNESILPSALKLKIVGGGNIVTSMKSKTE